MKNARCGPQKKVVAQAALEYFLLFLLMAGVTLLSISPFWTRIYDYANTFFWKENIIMSIPGNINYFE